MTPAFHPTPTAAYDPVRCASGCDSWAPHHFRLNGELRRVCSSCVLLSIRDAYCSVCLCLLSPNAYAAASHVDFSPGPTAACSSCGTFVAHTSCVADPLSFVCPFCAASSDNMPFSYDLAGSGQRVLDWRSARLLLTAAQLARDSALREAADAREKAERSVEEAAAARMQARAMLDAAFRAAQVEACMDAEEQVTPSSPAPAVELFKKKSPQSNGPKKNTQKSNEANKDRNTLLKFNDNTQQPALALAKAATAAAAGSVSLPVPSSRLGQNHVKQEAGGSADRAAKYDHMELFGTLQ